MFIGEEVIITNENCNNMIDGVVGAKGFIVHTSGDMCIIKMTHLTDDFPKRVLNSLCVYRNNIRATDNEVMYTSAYTHHLSFTNKFSRYWASYKRAHIDWYTKRREHKCVICGRVYSENSDKIIKTDSGKYICCNCSVVRDYCTKNNNYIKKPTNKGTRYGFELEGICRVNTRKNISKRTQVANVISLGYEIIPTSDCSLANNGVEFKTPIMNSLRGTKTMITKINKYVDFSHNTCGQHINMSNPQFTEEIRSYIYHHHKFLDILSREMYNRADDTRLVCGRHFDDTRYACCYSNYYSHTNWINLGNSGRAEFRLSKVRTPEQYVNLTRMWEEVMMVMVDYYNSHDISEKNNTKYGNRLIRIFNKYVKINKENQ